MLVAPPSATWLVLSYQKGFFEGAKSFEGANSANYFKVFQSNNYDFVIFTAWCDFGLS